MSNSMALFSQQIRSTATIQELKSLNTATSKYGLVLTEPDIVDLVEYHTETLRVLRRVEFGKGVLPDLVTAFASSPYVMQETYAETLAALQSSFYRLKEETDEKISDDNLIDSMRVLFDNEAQGSVEFFDSIDPNVLLAQASNINNDANENWSEFDSHKNEEEEFTKEHTASKESMSISKEEAHGSSKSVKQSEVDRVHEGGKYSRPDNAYASNFYDEYNELYRTGFDFNSRIGGSSL